MESKKTGWRKRNRMRFLKTSSALFALGFPLAHYGGTQNNHGVLALSFAVIGLACLLPIVAEK